ncbi:MAG: type II secretion system protein [Planctomycetota bacterium]
MRPAARSGFSLLEILLALSILGGSLAILSSIADTGVSSARVARDLSVARLLCQSKLSEVLLQAQANQVAPVPLPETPLESFDSESLTPFTYSVDVQPGQLDGLLIVRVVVTAQSTNQGAPPTATYSLVRWMVDPALGLEQLEAEEEAAREEAAAAEGAA